MGIYLGGTRAVTFDYPKILKIGLLSGYTVNMSKADTLGIQSVRCIIFEAVI